MPHVLVQHEVKDYDSWRTHFDADSEGRTNAGISNWKVYQVANSPNNVWITMEVADVTVLEQMANNPDWKAKLEAAGVIGEPTWTVLNEAWAPVSSN